MLPTHGDDCPYRCTAQMYPRSFNSAYYSFNTLFCYQFKEGAIVCKPINCLTATATQVRVEHIYFNISAISNIPALKINDLRNIITNRRTRKVGLNIRCFQYTNPWSLQIALIHQAIGTWGYLIYRTDTNNE